MRPIATFILIVLFHISLAQEAYFREIPSYPDKVNASNVLARMIDGLGYRYFWATEGLTLKDLDFRPSEKARTCHETLEHIFGLSAMIVSSVKDEVSQRPETSGMSFDELRFSTLENLRITSIRLKEMEAVAEIRIQFTENYSLPIWNLINGPVSDAIYHTGQVVSFRRTSGNPMNSKVNVLTGSDPEK